MKNDTPAQHQHGRIASIVHAWLDRAPKHTYVYERRVLLAREILLATLTALVTVRDARGGIAAGISLLIGLYVFETRRERASILGRHGEQGNAVPALPAHKQSRLDQLAWHDAVVAWVSPGLLAFIGAAHAQSVTVATAVAVISTYLRAAWDMRWMPAWRRSRVAWRAR